MERLGRSSSRSEIVLLKRAREDVSPDVRRATAEAYGRRGGEQGLDGLAVLVVDPDPRVVVAAARVLARLAPPGGSTDAREVAALQAGASRALVAGYGHADAAGRAEIAASLQSLGTSLREAVEAEARLLWDRNARTLAANGTGDRAGAAEELGRSGRAEAARMLEPLVRQEAKDPRLARAAVRGLGHCSGREVREDLVNALVHGSAEMAEAAADALAASSDPAAAEPLSRVGASGRGRAAAAAAAALEALPAAPEVSAGICEVAVRSPVPEVAERAARAAHAQGADCPERVLTPRIQRRGPDAAAALAALGALQLPPDRLESVASRAVPLLAPAVDRSLRVAAIRALGRAGYARAAAPLLDRARALSDRLGRSPREDVAVGDGEAEELAAVVVAMAGLRLADAPVLAARLAASFDPRLRAAAAEALGLVEGDAPLQPLARLLQDGDANVQVAAAAALGRHGASAVPVLAGEIASRQGPVRAELARALGATGSPAAVAALAPLLAGPEAAVAAEALGRLGNPEAVEPLVVAAAAGPAPGRIAAIEALGAMGAADGATVIAQQMTSDRPEVRVAATRAVGRLRHEGSAKRIEALRADYYVEVRRAANEALARLPAKGAPPAPRPRGAPGQ